MRIFVPLEVSDLQSEEISPRLVHYVSEKLAAVFPDADAEGLEYVATLAAADDSLRKMSADGAKGFRRIVGVAEVKNSMLADAEHDAALLESGIYLVQPFNVNEFESFLVDEPGNIDLVRRAVDGDEAAFLETEEIELLWYDAVERSALSRELLR
ncbi:DUF6912 family protein [Arcanobacterium hippocoleae]|uniref:Uncharacterized protein n=1 Tax=Arcanobacterium hippocoleae TaxID=149017 RepID=A0ABU1T3I1_9ACTO|nr:hypothetical protein [Arcanobacterium hippocoleae]MDR6939955.1 hypothetical protein [Arcanobacterium hippocoleae]